MEALDRHIVAIINIADCGSTFRKLVVSRRSFVPMWSSLQPG